MQYVPVHKDLDGRILMQKYDENEVVCFRLWSFKTLIWFRAPATLRVCLVFAPFEINADELPKHHRPHRYADRSVVGYGP